MKLFISWSGEFSRKVAERLSIWIPTIIQTVDVFYSPDDIAKGENWGNRLSEELEQSNFGIVCLTPENVSAPWIHFEAGALSKTANSRVSAIMLGINPSDVKGPLSRLQNTAFEREDFYRLFQSINNSSEKPLRPEILRNVFENSWEKLEHDIADIIASHSAKTPAPEAKTVKRDKSDSSNEALQELLRLVRNLDSQLQLISGSDNVRDTPISNSEPLERPDDTNQHIALSCPKEHVRKVMPIIRKYTSQDSDFEFIEYMLKEYELCSLSIPLHLLADFKLRVKMLVPEATVIS